VAPAPCQCDGLLILGGNSVVRAWSSTAFQLSGIRIEGLGTNVIQGNYLAQTLMEQLCRQTVKVAFISMNRPQPDRGNHGGGAKHSFRKQSGGNFHSNPKSHGQQGPGEYIGPMSPHQTTGQHEITASSWPARRNVVEGRQRRAQHYIGQQAERRVPPVPARQRQLDCGYYIGWMSPAPWA